MAEKRSLPKGFENFQKKGKDMKTASSKTNNETLIRELIDDLVTAVRAKETNGVISLFATDPVMFLLAPPLQSKSDQVSGRKNIQEWFDSFQSEIGYEIRDLEITAGDTAAFCHNLLHISGNRANGEVTDIWVRETLGFRKINNEWKIAHQHQSVPMYMDGSGKAAIDLKP